MKYRGLIAAAALLMVAPPQPSFAQSPSGMVPGGSYLDTCRNIQFDPATNLLDADCDIKEPGAWEGMPVRPYGAFDITGCAQNSIFNDNGTLYCFTEKPWGNGRIIPKGSYLASCAHTHVTNNVLIAHCDDPGDNAIAAELNLNKCRWGADIYNDHGSLRCEQIAAAEPMPVKPVAIEPGVVKPVSIAPIEPAGGATTTDSKEPRRKKRRDRGERG